MAKPPVVRWCKVKGCGLEAAPRRQVCLECWLAKQPPIIRAEHALARLEAVPPSARRKTVPKAQWPEGRRWCGGCQTMIRIADARGSQCQGCAYRSARRSKVMADFGIDEATYAALLALQGGRCAICGGKPRKVALAVDHFHGHRECDGKGCPDCIRGLLDSRCNHELLGAAHDSPHILRAAAAYLEAPPTSGRWVRPVLEPPPLGGEPAPF